MLFISLYSQWLLVTIEGAELWFFWSAMNESESVPNLQKFPQSVKKAKVTHTHTSQTTSGLVVKAKTLMLYQLKGFVYATPKSRNTCVTRRLLPHRWWLLRPSMGRCRQLYSLSLLSTSNYDAFHSLLAVLALQSQCGVKVFTPRRDADDIPRRHASHINN